MVAVVVVVVVIDMRKIIDGKHSLARIVQESILGKYRDWNLLKSSLDAAGCMLPGTAFKCEFSLASLNLIRYRPLKSQGYDVEMPGYGCGRTEDSGDVYLYSSCNFSF